MLLVAGTDTAFMLIVPWST